MGITRLAELIDDPYSDTLRPTDAPLIRSGLLLLNWTDRPNGRIHPFVTANPVAANYLSRYGKISAARMKLLKRDVPKRTASDLSWATEFIPPSYALQT